MNKRRKRSTFDAWPVQQEFLAGREFVSLVTSITRKRNIENATIVPPVLGQPGFGGLKVRYKRPIYRTP